MKRNRLLAFLLSLFAIYGSAQVVVNPPMEDDGLKVALLGSMDVSKTSAGWGNPMPNRSVDGNALTLADTVYTSGIGTHATAQVIVKLNGGARRFKAVVGIDDEVKRNSGDVYYTVAVLDQMGERSELAAGRVRSGYEPQHVNVEVKGQKYLIIEADMNGVDAYDHFDIANAYVTWTDEDGSASSPVIVSDAAVSSPLLGAHTVYSQPGVRFMHKLRAAEADAEVSVSNLPEGLKWNERRSLVEGVIDEEGVYTYNVRVSHGGETSEQPVTLTVSRNLQQPVPFMGWLSWNVFEDRIDETTMLETALAAKRYGLDTLGYRYMCLDDLWHSGSVRPSNGKPAENKAKFPHGLKYLTDSIHALGFCAGIYSDAAEKTCAGAYGSYGYEKADAKAYADWGFDILKYDYCGAPTDVATARKRYKAMGDALRESGRNIIFYMCEWGQREPWKWGAETGATCWRCTYDTRDFWDWGSRVDVTHIGVIQGVDVMKHLWPYAGVNRFNDADMMMVGLHGTGKSSNYDAGSYPTGRAGMTQEEYRSQFSLWAMFASPLTLSFDLRNISADDLNIISNAEMIAINQDHMGQQAELVKETVVNAGTRKCDVEVYVKDLENGDMAVAVFNRGEARCGITVKPEDFYGNPGERYVFHDVWGVSKDTEVGADGLVVYADKHQTRVFRVSPAGKPTGIKEAGSEPPALRVSQSGSSLSLFMGSNGVSKRILLSDAKGNVWKTFTTSDAEVSLPFHAPTGTYVVQTICAGRVQNAKFLWKSR